MYEVEKRKEIILIEREKQIKRKMGDIDLSELGLVSVPHSLQRIVDSRVFPLILSPSQPSAIASIYDWLKTHREVVDQLLRKYRSVLFRGFPNLQSVEHFHEAVIALDYTTMDYIGGAAVRTQLTSRVFTANESPSSENIPFHHEMAQTPHPPTHVMFFCAVPPSIGGETPLLASHEIYDRMQEQFPAIMEDLENTGVKYVRVLPEEDDHSSAIGRGWKSTFLCQTKGKDPFLRIITSCFGSMTLTIDFIVYYFEMKSILQLPTVFSYLLLYRCSIDIQEKQRKR